MKYLQCFSTLVTFFTGILWVVVSEENIDNMEVAYLASNLSPIECLRLLEDMYLKRPLSDEEFSRPETRTSLNDESIARQQLLAMPFFNRDDCRGKLQEWARYLPQGSTKWARMALEVELRSLRRPELAKYVKKNGRMIQYFNEMRRNSRNTGKHPSQDSQVGGKNNHVGTSNGAIKPRSKETATQYFPDIGESKSTKNHADIGPRREIGSVNAVSIHTNSDTTTKWTAFLTLLAVIILTILVTVIFALYKRNRGGKKVCVTENTCTSDHCPLADRYARGQTSCCNSDPERARFQTGSLRCGGRRRDGSRPPSTTFCVRHEETVCKSKPQKCFKIETKTPEKIGKRECPINCSSLKHEFRDRPINVDKSTLTKQRRSVDSAIQSEDRPTRAFQKLQEKIVGILKRENPPTCKCCKCSISLIDERSNGTKCFPLRMKNVTCEDDNCPKTRLKDIAEFCLSQDETSPTDEPKDPEMGPKRLRQKRKKKKKRTTRKEKSRDVDKDKESEKSSPENSARSKDKGFRIRKKPTKAKKERFNVVEACTRKTCGLDRANFDETSNFL